MKRSFETKAEITIEDDHILIHGWLEADLLGDLLLVFQERGYNKIVPGDQNSSLRLVRTEGICQQNSIPVSQYNSNVVDNESI